MYQDDLVCILRPDVKKGIIVWTGYKQPQNTDSFYFGIKNKRTICFGREKIYPYIFFRTLLFNRY